MQQPHTGEAMLLRLALTFILMIGTACVAPPVPAALPALTASPAPLTLDMPRSAPTSTPSITAPPVPTHTPAPTPVPPTPTIDPDLVLPDLGTLTPTDLILAFGSGGQRLLRFTNSIINTGPGVLEVLGQHDPDKDQVVVTQHIFRQDGTFWERLAGEFIFHPTHDHWHFENFARYEVWSLTSDRELDQLVALTDKVSYCIRDNVRGNGPAAAARSYVMCDQDLQGISVGWVDIYEFDTPGQIVDVTDLPYGVYALQSIVDPADQLWEDDNANNSGLVYFELFPNFVRLVDE
jgi:hypothetical protein